MFGPVVLLAALASPAPPATAQALDRRAEFRPSSSATAHATVSIRIISGVRFGEGQVQGEIGAARRKTQLADADGISRSAELLEFQ